MAKLQQQVGGWLVTEDIMTELCTAQAVRTSDFWTCDLGVSPGRQLPDGQAWQRPRHEPARGGAGHLDEATPVAPWPRLRRRCCSSRPQLFHLPQAKIPAVSSIRCSPAPAVRLWHALQARLPVKRAEQLHCHVTLHSTPAQWLPAALQPRCCQKRW